MPCSFRLQIKSDADSVFELLSVFTRDADKRSRIDFTFVKDFLSKEVPEIYTEAGMTAIYTRCVRCYRERGYVQADAQWGNGDCPTLVT